MCSIEFKKKMNLTKLVWQKNGFKFEYLFAFSILLLNVYISLLTKHICKTQETKKLELRIGNCEFYLLLLQKTFPAPCLLYLSYFYTLNRFLFLNV